MAADSAPRGRMAQAIGTVQTAQRLGPALGPVVGGIVAQLVGLRRAFLVTAVFYLGARSSSSLRCITSAARPRMPTPEGEGRITFRNVLAFENFLLLMAVIFGLQFVDRSFGPILPLYVAELGTSHRPHSVVSGVLFSICGRRRRRWHTTCAAAAVADAHARGDRQFGGGCRRGHILVCVRRRRWRADVRDSRLRPRDRGLHDRRVYGGGASYRRRARSGIRPARRPPRSSASRSARSSAACSATQSHPRGVRARRRRARCGRGRWCCG